VTGPCGGFPHLFEHHAMRRIRKQRIVCIYCGKLAVRYTQAQILAARQAVLEDRY